MCSSDYWLGITYSVLNIFKQQSLTYISITVVRGFRIGKTNTIMCRLLAWRPQHYNYNIKIRTQACWQQQFSTYSAAVTYRDSRPSASPWYAAWTCRRAPWSRPRGRSSRGSALPARGSWSRPSCAAGCRASSAVCRRGRLGRSSSWARSTARGCTRPSACRAGCRSSRRGPWRARCAGRASAGRRGSAGRSRAPGCCTWRRWARGAACSCSRESWWRRWRRAYGTESPPATASIDK